MAVTIQICAKCKHEHGTQPAIVVDGLTYHIMCPCVCHTKVKPW